MRARARDIAKRKHGAPVHPVHPDFPFSGVRGYGGTGVRDYFSPVDLPAVSSLYYSRTPVPSSSRTPEFGCTGCMGARCFL